MPSVGEDVSSLMGGGVNVGERATFTANGQSIGDAAMHHAGGAVKEFASTLNPAPMVQALGESHFNPQELAINVGVAASRELLDGIAAWKAGDKDAASRHALRAIPLFGGQADHLLSLAEQGEWGRVLGGVAALSLPFANKWLPRAVKFGGVSKAKGAIGDAVQWAKAEGLPLDLATATDNSVVRSGQHVVERATVGGLTVTPELQAQQAAALASKARGLAAEASPGVGPQTNISAGESVANELNAAVRARGSAADTSYDRVRGTLAQTAPETVTVKGKPVDIVAPVDLAPLKQTIKAISDDMNLWSETRRQASPAFSAVRNVLSGPDVVSLEQAEQLLGALKELGRGRRGASGEGLATSSERLGIVASRRLQSIVNAAAQKAGVLDDLNAGRTATREQYVLDRIRREVTGKKAGDPVEPGAIFDRLTADHDLTIKRLKTAMSVAPNAKPLVARAVLEDLFRPSLKGDGFSRELGLSRNWDNLGPQMKAQLFGPVLTDRVTKFIRFAEQVGKNANPSGSGHVAILGGTFASAAGGIGALFQGAPGALLGLAATEIATVGLAKALRNPVVIRAITEGLSVPVRGPVATGAKGAVLRPGSGAVPSMSPVPVVAGESKQ